VKKTHSDKRNLLLDEKLIYNKQPTLWEVTYRKVRNHHLRLLRRQDPYRVFPRYVCKSCSGFYLYLRGWLSWEPIVRSKILPSCS